MSRVSTASVAPDLQVSPVELPSARALTGPRGGLSGVPRDPELNAHLHGVTAARVILFNPDNPAEVVMRQGKSGAYGLIGGGLLVGEHPVLCALREGREESRVRSFPNLGFVSVLVHETKGIWLNRSVWESWGYSSQGRAVEGDSIRVANIRTAIFSAPLSEPFRERTVEGRSVRLLDVSSPECAEQIRPMFQHLLGLWADRLVNRSAIPPRIRYTRG
ncbi:MAG: NUDIX domain-containing protein [Deltaproteobacteria bacterium]|nr:NUDIX domain-containing protein [Deltaproteobacteria bacterium]